MLSLLSRSRKGWKACMLIVMGETKSFKVVAIPAQVQSPIQSSAVALGVEAGGRFWNLNQSLLRFAVVPFPHSLFPLSPIFLKTNSQSIFTELTSLQSTLNRA